MNYSKLIIIVRRFKRGELLSLRVVLTLNGTEMSITHEFSVALSFGCINSKELASETKIK